MIYIKEIVACGIAFCPGAEENERGHSSSRDYVCDPINLRSSSPFCADFPSFLIALVRCNLKSIYIIYIFICKLLVLPSF